MRYKFWWLLALMLCVVLAGCGKSGDGTGNAESRPAQGDPGRILTVLAGSEIKDIEPLLPQIEKATGLHLQMQYVGTLDAVEQLQNGANFDLAWLASSKYAMLTPGVRERVKGSERIMISPVVLGVKQQKAHELGWDDIARPPTWQEIAQAAGAGKFRFGMTNPASSNTGFAAVLGLASALSGKGEAMELADIDFKTLGAFAHAQSVTAGSSGWLAELYQREEESLDGMVNYASVMNALNASGKLKDPLFLVYPRDGVLTADYPLMLLNEQKRSDYDRLVAYLKGQEFQAAMTKLSFRTPVNNAVLPAVAMPTYFEMAFPAKRAVIDGLLDAFLNTVRKSADSTFVVDVSGSMTGERLQQLQTALLGLAGQDTSLSGRFARLHDRERISLLRFSSTVEDQRVWTMGTDTASNSNTLKSFSAYVGNLHANGSTALYSAAQQAYQAALERQRRDPERLYTVLLMTDGQSNAGVSVEEFSAWIQSLPPSQHKIRIYAVLFGEASGGQLENITQPTGGRVFDANKGGLQAAFKEIRGYQ
jgi:Ca-activated chloride channel family protein